MMSNDLLPKLCPGQCPGMPTSRRSSAPTEDAGLEVALDVEASLERAVASMPEHAGKLGSASAHAGVDGRALEASGLGRCEGSA
eukprot:2942171-Prymnesium_polylepis.2